MKALIVVLAFLVFSAGAYGQGDSSSTNSVAFLADKNPEFPGGDQALMTFLLKNVVYPESERLKAIEGKVLIRFLVDTDGSTKDVQLIKSVSPELDKEAMRVVKMLPRFTPGYRLGVPVRVYYNLPVVFRLTGPTISEEEKQLKAKFEKDEYFRKAAILLGTGLFKEATKQVKKSIKAFPNQYVSYAVLAECESKLGRKKAACKDYGKARSLGLPEQSIAELEKICH